MITDVVHKVDAIHNIMSNVCEKWCHGVKPKECCGCIVSEAINAVWETSPVQESIPVKWMVEHAEDRFLDPDVIDCLIDLWRKESEVHKT